MLIGHSACLVDYESYADILVTLVLGFDANTVRRNQGHLGSRDKYSRSVVSTKVADYRVIIGYILGRPLYLDGLTCVGRLARKRCVVDSERRTCVHFKSSVYPSRRVVPVESSERSYIVAKRPLVAV